MEESRKEKIYNFSGIAPRGNKHIVPLFSLKFKENEMCPIIIDNGSYECRAGYMSSEIPHLIFRNYTGKPKTHTKDNEGLVLVGNELTQIVMGKMEKKGGFERDVMLQTKYMELMLDHIFGQLDIKSERVNHPIFLTECLGNPNTCRSRISELLFECYGVPSICYGVDSLFSYYYNTHKDMEDSAELSLNNGFIINAHHSATHLLPLLNGRSLFKYAKRINIGGQDHINLLHKWIHLRYPQHKQCFNHFTIEEIIKGHGYCASNYSAQLGKLENKFKERCEKNILKDKHKDDEMLVQLGLKEPEEEINKSERKNKLHRADIKTYYNRISYQNELLDAREILPTLQDEHILQLPWSPLQGDTEDKMRRKQELRREQGNRLKEYMAKKKFQREAEYTTELEHLQTIINRKGLDEDSGSNAYNEAISASGKLSEVEMSKRIAFLMGKLGIEMKEEKELNEEEKYPLINISDDKLTPQELKQKRVQKMHRTAANIRIEKKQQEKLEKQKELDLIEKDPKKYIFNLYSERQEILNRIGKRKKQQEELNNRTRRSAQNRMQIIAELGMNEEKVRRNREMDMFGASDDDWEMYRGISKTALAEENEEDEQQLLLIHDKLSQIDPRFDIMLKGKGSEEPRAEDWQVPLSSERFRGIECLFQPGIIGVDQAGIIELMQQILRCFREKEIESMMSRIHLTGGHSLIPNFLNRLKTEIRSILPTQMEFNIVQAFDPLLDSWKGARLFALNNNIQNISMTKQEYDEYGTEYFKEHICSNKRYLSHISDSPSPSNSKRRNLI